MNTDNKPQPLYKVLNEQRSQGTIEMDIIEKEGKIYLLPDTGVVFCSFYCFPFDDKIKADAQYTALAVNNFHKLAEALEDITKEYECAIKLLCEANGMTYSENSVIIHAKKVLQAIS